MKKIFIILILLLVTSGLWIAWRGLTVYRAYTTAPVPAISTTPPPPPSGKEVPTVEVNQTVFTYDVIRVATASAVTLLPNFTEKQDAQSIRTANGCTSVVNGGFYTENNRPLGLFQIGTRVYGPSSQSALVNGYIWVDAQENFFITSEIPEVSRRFALQSGPLLLFNGQTLPLTIHNDTGARRMAAAKTMDNALLFLAVYTEDSVFDGPLLADLPLVIEKISDEEKLDIAEAINLDGGSASVFYQGETTISELTPVGSLFCIK